MQVCAVVQKAILLFDLRFCGFNIREVAIKGLTGYGVRTVCGLLIASIPMMQLLHQRTLRRLRTFGSALGLYGLGCQGYIRTRLAPMDR